MTAIGITGHTRLSKESVTLIMEALREEIRKDRGSPVHGVTCLAAGTDQLFAEAILEVGGTYDVVLPAKDYRDAVVSPENRSDFDRLLAKAASVHYMPFAESVPNAYEAACVELVRRSGRLIAVWDGQPGTFSGGTADVVKAAEEAGLEVRTIWPSGAKRF